MYVELITILVRAKDDITRACRRCQSTLYIVFNIAEVGGPHHALYYEDMHIRPAYSGRV